MGNLEVGRRDGDQGELSSFGTALPKFDMGRFIQLPFPSRRSGNEATLWQGQPRNLYPNPCTVIRYSGSAGERSIF